MIWVETHLILGNGDRLVNNVANLAEDLVKSELSGGLLGLEVGGDLLGLLLFSLFSFSGLLVLSLLSDALLDLSDDLTLLIAGEAGYRRTEEGQKQPPELLI